MDVLPISSLFELSSVASPVMQPNGENIVFIKTDLIEEENTYVSQLFCYNQTTQKTTQWTDSTGSNYAPAWSADGTKLAFISTRNEKPQVYVLDVTGGEAQQVTSATRGVSQFVWSPDNTTIFYTSSISDNGKDDKPIKPYETEDGKVTSLLADKLTFKADGAGFLDTNAHTQIFSITLEDKKVTQLTFDVTNHSLCDVSPDGSQILYARKRDFENQKELNVGIYALDIPSKKITQLTEKFEHASFGEALFSPDNKRIAFVGSNRKVISSNVYSIYIYDCTSKDIINLLDKEEMHVSDCGTGDFKQKSTGKVIQWKDNETLFFITSHLGKVSLYQTDLSQNLQPVLNGLEHIFDISYSETKGQIAFGCSTPTIPNEIEILDLKDNSRTTITAFNEELKAKYTFNDYVEIEYSTEDGKSIHGFLAMPANFDASKKYPLIYDIHGGPHTMHASTFFHEVQLMTARGYCVLLLDPRGSFGYGQDHVNGVLGDYGGGDYRDLMTGLDGVLAQFPWIDENRLYVTGGSYGGFMTNWIVTQTDRFRSGVTQRSISNWVSFTGVSDIGYFFTEWELEAGNFDFEKMWKHSPLAYVKNVKTPLLLLHSEEDHRCPMEQAEQFYTYLQYLDVPSELRRFPQSSHGLSREGIPSLRVERLEAMFDWFNRYE